MPPLPARPEPAMLPAAGSAGGDTGRTGARGKNEGKSIMSTITIRAAHGAALLGAALIMALAPVAAQTKTGVHRPDEYEIEICNGFYEDVVVAVNYIHPDDAGSDYWTYEGWFVVSPGDCDVLAETVNRYFYVYAEARYDDDTYWGGNHGQCVKYPGPYEFRLHKSDDCPYNADVVEYEQHYIDDGYDGFKLTLD